LVFSSCWWKHWCTQVSYLIRRWVQLELRPPYLFNTPCLVSVPTLFLHITFLPWWNLFRLYIAWLDWADNSSWILACILFFIIHAAGYSINLDQRSFIHVGGVLLVGAWLLGHVQSFDIVIWSRSFQYKLLKHSYIRLIWIPQLSLLLGLLVLWSWDFAHVFGQNDLFLFRRLGQLLTADLPYEISLDLLWIHF